MNDDELRRLLSDAVSDIEPDDRLDQIRASVHADPQVVPMSRTRPWRYAAVGVAATVAVIGGVAWAAGDLPGRHQADDGTPVGPGPSSRHTTPDTPVSSPTHRDVDAPRRPRRARRRTPSTTSARTRPASRSSSASSTADRAPTADPAPTAGTC